MPASSKISKRVRVAIGGFGMHHVIMVQNSENFNVSTSTRTITSTITQHHPQPALPCSSHTHVTYNPVFWVLSWQNVSAIVVAVVFLSQSVGFCGKQCHS